MKQYRLLVICLFVLLLLPGSVGAQSTTLSSSFTYQGHLTGASGAVSGTCDFEFSLFNALAAGAQVGSTLTSSGVAVNNGRFNVVLDFGAAAFDGTDRYLAISVRCPAGAGAYTALAPRQPLTPAPYSQFAGRAPWTGLGGIPAGFGDNTDNDALAGLTCADGQVAQFNGTAWVCATPGGGDITTVTAGTGLAGGGASGDVTLNADPTYLQRRVTGSCAPGSALVVISEDGAVNCERFWSLSGNAGTDPVSQFIGTTDNQAFEIRVNNGRVMRYEPNATSPNLIAGASSNSVSFGVVGAVIGGGGQGVLFNLVSDEYGVVSGGANNQAGNAGGTATDATYATVSGGWANIASSSYTFVGGGYNNGASAPYDSIGGGRDNIASGGFATVPGGNDNTASSDGSTVGGGKLNTASGELSVIAGGILNTADGSTTTIGGGENNIATGGYATVPGGVFNTAFGTYSFAAGRRAKANHTGSFVWGDSSDFDIASTAVDQFSVRAIGGTRFISAIDGTGAPTAGVELAAGGGSWSSLSDRSAKENIEIVDTLAILQRVAEMPIATWNYIAQDDDVRHIGPMAQDFYEAFGVGEGDTHITTIDADGVALAAIQGLNQLVEEQRTEIDALRAENAALTARLDAVESRLDAIEAAAQPMTESSLVLPGLLLGALAFALKRRDRTKVMEK